MNPRAASSIVSALPSRRMLLLFGGVLLLSESVALATTLFAFACVSFAVTLVLATKMYRASGRRPLPNQLPELDEESAAARHSHAFPGGSSLTSYNRAVGRPTWGGG